MLQLFVYLISEGLSRFYINRKEFFLHLALISGLERHGAARIYPRVDCDVDYETPAKRWLAGVLAKLLDDKPAVLSA